MTDKERKAIYQTLCEKKKIKQLFLQPWWLDATGQWDVAFAYRNDQVVGAMPFAIRKKWGIKYLGMPAFTHHLKIWMDKPPDVSDHKWLTREKQIIWSLVEHLPKHGFFSMVFSENSFNNWLPFYWNGFRQEMRYTFIIEAADESEIDLQINRNFKRTIRQAMQIIRIEKDIDPGAFYTMCKETYKRQYKPIPYSPESFLKIDQAIYAHHAGVRLGAYDSSNQLIAVSYLIWDDNTAYYFLAGDNDTGRVCGASILLCRAALKVAFVDQKVKKFDFCGSMLELITEVRRQFGAQASPLMKIFKANYRWLDVLYKLTR